MKELFDNSIAAIWNRLRGRGRGARHEGRGVDLGYRVVDEEITRTHVTLSNTQRTMHVAVLGKTGSGKSYLDRYMLAQDIEADRGFVCFDLHREFMPFLLGTINARERRLR